MQLVSSKIWPTPCDVHLFTAADPLGLFIPLSEQKLRHLGIYLGQSMLGILLTKSGWTGTRSACRPCAQDTHGCAQNSLRFGP